MNDIEKIRLTPNLDNKISVTEIVRANVRIIRQKSL